MTVSEGYRDGLAGRSSASDNPDYSRGWLTGWRERMLAWNNTSRPVDGR